MNIFKDYQLVANRLYKFHLKESKHLYWAKGGVPCIDKKVWDEHGGQVDGLAIKTDKGRTFRIDREVFDAHKESINHGFGEQYVVDKTYWSVDER